ncbi:VWA domain-containing protein [Candidatus Gracilibacteria bacterium]|nr:VWA domain-containing protein [Candidatus Gracilibacteria bacterium]
MKKRSLLAVLVLLLVLLVPLWFVLGGSTAAGQATGTRIAQIDSSAYPEITLYVTVEDANSVPQSGLRSADFAVTEDGVPVTITEFGGGGSANINTALVLDVSGSMGEDAKLEGAQAAARSFVELMRPGDETALIAFSDEPDLIEDFSDDSAELQDEIEGLYADGSTALYDSIIAGVDALRSTEGRRALLLLTDGRDIRSTTSDERASEASLDEAIAYAQRYEQSIYVVGLGERDGGQASGIDEQVLQQIADETGGSYFYAPRAAELATLYARIAGDIQREYQLTYTSPRPNYDGTRRDIQVLVGGAASTGIYAERHLINVTSNPLVGTTLLLPLLFLLLAPPLVRRRKQTPTPAPLPTITEEPTRCLACSATLRPSARFCSTCGHPQRVPQHL